jgi:hypothetical protein
MKWKNANNHTMINLDKVDAYEYIVAEDFVKTVNIDHPLLNTFKMCGNYLKLYVNGATIELYQNEADEVYKMLSR